MIAADEDAAVAEASSGNFAEALGINSSEILLGGGRDTLIAEATATGLD